MFMHTISDYILLLVSFAFNFFIPGYVVTEFLFASKKQLFKVPLYLFGSVIASTCLIFIVSLIFGLTDIVIFISYVFWFLSFLYVLNTKRKIIINIKNKMIYIFTFLVFIIFYLALKNAIFYRYENYYVMSADNWQDTALHLSIIESIKEGNFPPQAP